MKRRGPGCPQKYPEPTEARRRAACHNISNKYSNQCGCHLIQAEDLNQLKQVFGIIHSL